MILLLDAILGLLELEIGKEEIYEDMFIQLVIFKQKLMEE